VTLRTPLPPPYPPFRLDPEGEKVNFFAKNCHFSQKLPFFVKNSEFFFIKNIDFCQKLPFSLFPLTLPN
jgi:hypothetical protein